MLLLDELSGRFTNFEFRFEFNVKRSYFKGLIHKKYHLLNKNLFDVFCIEISEMGVIL